MHFLLITDLSDPRVSPYRNIPDPELLQSRGLFVAEGRLVVRRLLTESRYKTQSVIVTEPARAALADLLETRPDVPVYVVPPSMMNGITSFNVHRGCLAIGERGTARDWRQLLQTPDAPPIPRMLVLLERVANPDNVGGI